MKIHETFAKFIWVFHLVLPLPTGGSGLGVLRGDDPEVELLANAFWKWERQNENENRRLSPINRSKGQKRRWQSNEFKNETGSKSTTFGREQ